MNETLILFCLFREYEICMSNDLAALKYVVPLWQSFFHQRLLSITFLQSICWKLPPRLPPLHIPLQKKPCLPTHLTPLNKIPTIRAEQNFEQPKTVGIGYYMHIWFAWPHATAILDFQQHWSSASWLGCLNWPTVIPILLCADDTCLLLTHCYSYTGVCSRYLPVNWQYGLNLILNVLTITNDNKCTTIYVGLLFSYWYC